MITPTPIDQIVFAQAAAKATQFSNPTIELPTPSFNASTIGIENVPTPEFSGSSTKTFDYFVIGILIAVVIAGITYLVRRYYYDRRKIA